MQAPAGLNPADLRRYAPLLLLPLFGIFYFPLLSGQAFLWEDIPELNYPLVLYAVDSLRHLQLPFWTPYVFGGMPFFSDPQTTLFYPPFWLFIPVAIMTGTSIVAYTWYILLHILLLGFGTYFLGRNFGFERVTALFAAAVFMFCGFVSLHVMHTFIFVVAWFPLIFLFLRRAYASGRFRDILIAALLHGFSLLGGYPQYSMHLAYFFVLWTALDVWMHRREGVKPAARRIAFFGVFMAAGLALAAIQYLPSFEHMAESAREKMSFEESANGAVAIWQIVCFFAPKFFGWLTGNPGAGSPFWAFPGQSFLYWETAFFIGITPLFLMMRSLLDIRRDWKIAFFAGLAALLFLLALGASTPLYSLVFHAAPGFKTFRIPGRFLFGMSFCLVMLAGMGMDRLLKRDEKADLRFQKMALAFGGAIAGFSILFLAGAFNGASIYFERAEVLKNSQQAAIIALLMSVLAGGGIMWLLRSKSRTIPALAITGLAFCELFAFGHTFGCSPSNPRAYYDRFDLSPLQREYAADKFRIQGRLFQGPGKGEMLFPRNLGNVKQLPLIEGYNQLNLQRYGKLIFEVNESVGQRLFNIRYRKIPGQYTLERMPTTPRFYLSPHYTIVPDRVGVIAAMNAPDFEPGRDLVLESAPGIAVDTTNGARGSVRIVNENPNSIRLEVNAGGNTVLSASEPYFSAWKAYVDGKRTPLMPVNLLFRAIPVPKGEHIVEMKFQSSRFVLGTVISLMSLLTILGILSYGAVRARLRG